MSAPKTPLGLRYLASQNKLAPNCARPPRLPARLTETGIVLGWSLEDSHPEPVPYGFSYGPRPRPANPEDWDPILQRGEGHLMTIAPTGAGKGVSAVIPKLLRYEGQAVVIDPKSENYLVTASARKAMGQRIILLDPFDVCGSGNSDRLGPLDLMRPDLAPAVRGRSPGAKREVGSDYVGDLARQISHALVPHLPDLRDPVWENAARRMVSALLTYILENTPSNIMANLAELVFLLSQSLKDIILTTRDMALSKHTFVKAAADGAFPSEAKARANVVSTALNAIEFLQGRALEVTQGSNFHLNDFLNGRPMTIHMVPPPDKLPSQRRLLRLWTTTLLSTLSLRRRRPHIPTLFLMGDASQLGRMDEFLSAVTLMRGYGVNVWSFWQDLSQISTLYPTEWKTIHNNTHTRASAFLAVECRFAQGRHEHHRS
ncbi:MAG: type IV secretory system conjugative DNA transfer family protein [Pseudomonadota bacterium]